ncbi:hypothetical protein MLD52_06940 [Puniceicoccaceae bacterium K14]|nr:hypothetical protein [Puniceicoccaceae bacterium K14]
MLIFSPYSILFALVTVPMVIRAYSEQNTNIDGLLDEILYGEQVSFYWKCETSASLGYGYRENVLLGEANEIDSSFVFTGVEVIAARKMPNRDDEWLMSFFLENRAFSDVPDFDNETLFFGGAYYSLKLESIGNIGSGIEYIYTSQALDSSLDDVEISSLTLNGKRTSIVSDFSFRETNRFKLSIGQMELDGTTSDYDLKEISYLKVFHLGDSNRIEFLLKGGDKNFVERLARSDEGEYLNDDFLELREWEAKLAFEHYYLVWGLKGEMRFYGRYSKQWSGTSGYYDRNVSKLGVRFLWEKEGWKVSLDGSYREADYDVRLGYDGLRQADDSWSWLLDVERKLPSGWRVYLQLDASERETNEFASSYQANTIMFGLRFPAIRL